MAVVPTDAFACFFDKNPSSASSIRDGLNWLASAEPCDKTGLIFIPTLSLQLALGRRRTTYVRENLGDDIARKLLEERKARFRGRDVRLETEEDVKAGRDLVDGGPVLAFWPTLAHLQLLAKLTSSCIGIVVWSFDEDVAPFLADEAS